MQRSFFLLGAGDANNSGDLPGSAWLVDVGDVDGDGGFDVFEDQNHNGRLDPGEDIDGDLRLTPRSIGGLPGCEGVTREDIDCDGRGRTETATPDVRGVPQLT